jgi:hypothetical protein
LSQRSFLVQGVEVVEHNVDGGIRIGGDDVVHEVEEFDAARAFLVGGNDLAGGDLEGSKLGQGAVTGQRPAVRQLEIALRPFRRLD